MPGYKIHSIVRSPRSRFVRAEAAAHPRFVQRFGASQRRIVRGRDLEVSEQEVRDNLEELKAAEKSGVLELLTADGRKVDLDTLKPAPVPPTPPAPHPPLDSVANDIPRGLPTPQHQGNLPPEAKPKLSESLVADDKLVKEHEKHPEKHAEKHVEKHAEKHHWYKGDKK